MTQTLKCIEDDDLSDSEIKKPNKRGSMPAPNFAVNNNAYFIAGGQ